MQYGPSTGYGSLSGAQIIALGTAGGSPLSVPLSGLQAGTAYHARLRVASSAGTTTSGDVAFATNGASGSSSSGAERPGSESGSGSGSGAGTNAGQPTGAGTGVAGAAACLRVQAKRRGPAAKYLSVPTIEQISAAHPLNVALARAAKDEVALLRRRSSVPQHERTRRQADAGTAEEPDDDDPLRALGGASQSALAADGREQHALRRRAQRQAGRRAAAGDVSRLTRSHGVVLSLARITSAGGSIQAVSASVR